MGQLKRAAADIDTGRKPMTFMEAMQQSWGKIEAVLPKHMSSERLFQMAVTAYKQDEKLARCSIPSFLSCVMKCSALGLEPSSVDGLGRAYILPFWNKKTRSYEATFMLGYKGMIDLARRSGEIASISARAVYEGDVFEYEYGLEEKCRHIPLATDRTPDKLTHAYCVAKFKDGGHYLDVMTRAEIDKVRERSQAKDYGPWVTDFEAMAKKSPVRRAFPYLPVSVEAQMAAASDETDGGFAAQIIDSGAILPDAADMGSEEDPAGAPAGAGDAPRAVCGSCGNVVECAPDAELDDLNQIGCCEAPDYSWAR